MSFVGRQILLRSIVSGLNAWTVVEHLRKNSKARIGPILLLGRLPMRRDYRPIIITLVHPENHGGSSYLLASAAKI